jgi:hypothetical protein
MTPQEFDYLKRAMEALEQPPHRLTRAKIMRTMAQILNKAAAEYEREFQDLVDQNMAHAHLMKVLKDGKN